jgi:hypothetical protein
VPRRELAALAALLGQKGSLLPKQS